jgi:phosphoribosylamine--glycine ligase
LADVLIFGPTKAAAQLETSKTFAKSFMRAAGIPTADYAEFTVLQVTEAKDYVRSMQLPIVIKADGLAAGKGVIIAQTLTEAETAIDEMFDGRFGNAGNRILIEQFLTGREFSVFIAIHGDNYVTLPVAKDYKKVYDHDLGPNTGGMGSVSPVPFVTATMMEKVHDQIIEPTVLQLQKQGIHYTGFIFFGLIAVGDDPFVIEYNARFGDPEAESVFPRIQSDMVQVITDLMCGRAVEGLALDQRFATGIYVTAAGYPESYPKGVPISLTAIPEDNYIFHGGTQRSPEGKLVNSGGRVLFIGAMDVDLETARAKALDGAKAMDFDKKHFRTDIGYDAC